MCEVDYLHLGLSLPALRGTQGGRDVFVTLPNNNVINTFFPTHVEGAPGSSDVSLDEDKIEGIESYIEARSDSFVLGPITYATDSECVFEPALEGAQFGVLRLPLNAKLRSLDGQHRREALRSVVERINAIGQQHTALILYVEPRLDRRRVMFSDLNRAKTDVGAGPSSIGDESRTAPPAVQSPFRAAAEILATTHPFLTGRVDLVRRQGRRRKSSFSLDDVERCLKRLVVGPIGRVKHPERFDAEVIRDRGWMLFDGLLAAAQRVEGESSEVLGWNSMLPVAAGATWVITDETGDHQITPTEASAALSTVDFSPSGNVWTNSGLATNGVRNSETRRRDLLSATDLLVKRLTMQHRNDQSVSAPNSHDPLQVGASETLPDSASSSASRVSYSDLPLPADHQREHQRASR